MYSTLEPQTPSQALHHESVSLREANQEVDLAVDDYSKVADDYDEVADANENDVTNINASPWQQYNLNTERSVTAAEIQAKTDITKSYRNGNTPPSTENKDCQNMPTEVSWLYSQ